MKLQEKLDAMVAASKKKFSPDKIAIMDRAKADVSRSLAARNIPRVGAPLPRFELPDVDGRLVDSQQLAAAGPFVLTFFRGTW